MSNSVGVVCPACLERVKSTRRIDRYSPLWYKRSEYDEGNDISCSVCCDSDDLERGVRTRYDSLITNSAGHAKHLDRMTGEEIDEQWSGVDGCEVRRLLKYMWGDMSYMSEGVNDGWAEVEEKLGGTYDNS